MTWSKFCRHPFRHVGGRLAVFLLSKFRPPSWVSDCPGEEPYRREHWVIKNLVKKDVSIIYYQKLSEKKRKSTAEFLITNKQRARQKRCDEASKYRAVRRGKVVRGSMANKTLV